jgi:hypothetical protein
MNFKCLFCVKHSMNDLDIYFWIMEIIYQQQWKGWNGHKGKFSLDTLSQQRLDVSQYRFYPGSYMVFVITLPSCQVCDYQHCISTDTEEVIYLVQYGSSFGHIYVPDIKRCWRKDFCLKSINVINWQETWPKGWLTFWGQNYISLPSSISKSSKL